VEGEDEDKIQQKCVEALKSAAYMPTNHSEEEKIEMKDKAMGAIILCLRDKVMREIAKETSVVAMWTKLDSLYMTKSLAHKHYLK
jgi:predicted oxidoreductase (fatty acid repression mutant protein)